MNLIEKKLLEKVEKQLKMDIIYMDGEETITIICDNKCRLLSHLLHRTGLDVHCTKEGVFKIPTKEYTHNQIMNALYEVHIHPEWVIEFVEKYHKNTFMMNSIFGDD